MNITPCNTRTYCSGDVYVLEVFEAGLGSLRLRREAVSVPCWVTDRHLPATTCVFVIFSSMFTIAAAHASDPPAGA